MILPTEFWLGFWLVFIVGLVYLKIIGTIK
jgi:hypothetical protein